MNEKDLQFYKSTLNSNAAPTYIQQQVLKTKDISLLKSLLSLNNLDETILKEIKSFKDEEIFMSLLEFKRVTGKEINAYVLATNLTDVNLILLLASQEALSLAAYKKIVELSAENPEVMVTLLKNETFPKKLNSSLAKVLAESEKLPFISESIILSQKEILFEGLEKHSFTPYFLKLMSENFKAHDFKNLPQLFAKVLNSLKEADNCSVWYSPPFETISAFFSLLLEPFNEISQKFYSLKEYEALREIYAIKDNKEILEKCKEQINFDIFKTGKANERKFLRVLEVLSLEERISSFNENILNKEQLCSLFTEASTEEKFNMLFHPLLSDSDFVSFCEEVVGDVSEEEFIYLFLKSNDYRVAFLGGHYFLASAFENFLKSHENPQNVLTHMCGFINEGQLRLNTFVLKSSFVNEKHLKLLTANDFKSSNKSKEANELFSKLLEDNLVTSQQWEIFLNLFHESELSLQEMLETATTI